MHYRLSQVCGNFGQFTQNCPFRRRMHLHLKISKKCKKWPFLHFFQIFERRCYASAAD